MIDLKYMNIQGTVTLFQFFLHIISFSFTILILPSEGFKHYKYIQFNWAICFSFNTITKQNLS